MIAQVVLEIVLVHGLEVACDLVLVDWLVETTDQRHPAADDTV